MWFLWSALALAGVTVTLPATDTEVVFDGSAATEVEGAYADLTARRFEAAARRFGALADASARADLRYLQAVAAYEGGELRIAEAAAKAGLALAPGDAPLLSVYGLVLADTGKGDDAIATLDKALASGPDDALAARIVLNRGVVRLDRGEAALAEVDFRDAKARAEKAGETATAAQAAENLGLVAGLRGDSGATDPIGVVAEKLRKGDVAGAKAAIPEAPADRRGRVRVLIAKGNVARAEGRLDDAVTVLTEAASLAKQGGLVREEAAALAQIGVVYGVAGKYELSVDRLQEAISLVSGTSFRVSELAYRAEAGRMAVRMDDVAQAEGQLAVGRKIAPGIDDPLGVARLDELAGLIAAEKDDAVAAVKAYDAALLVFETHGDWAEAARIATEIVEVHAGRDDAALAAARTRAEGLFAKARDGVGPAHVRVAEGLGRGRRGDLDGALRAFTDAAKLAEATGTARGKQVALVAREDAAQTLLALGHSADSAAKAKQYGLDEVLAAHEKFTAAEASYDAARKAYDAKKWAEAEKGFDEAYRTLDAIGEHGHAALARRGRAWSIYNRTVGKPAAEGHPVWQMLVEEAVAIGDPELRARAMGAGALDAADLGRPEAVTSLRAAADEAERLGLASLAGHLHSRRATAEPLLDDRLAAARRAWSLRTDDVGVYAMYAVAVDLYNEGRYEEAQAVADEVLPKAGKLASEVTKVRDAARSASGG